MLKTERKAEQKVIEFQEVLDQTDTVLIGAGAGLSTAAGFAYGGEPFRRYFADFDEKYGFHDMYSGGFYPFPTLEEHWAYWSRFVFLNRYCDPPKPVYKNLLELVKDKDYFVLTTNVDHCFQKAGFDKHRLFYTQGDYGLWQCSKSCHNKTYDNGDIIRQMVEAQGFQVTGQGMELPTGTVSKMAVPTELVPHCPKCGAPMAMNLRADHTFVQDEGWYIAAGRYDDFVRRHKNTPVLYLELGVGMNTPGIIKYNFWRQVYQNPKANYICINKGQSYAPREIANRSICLDMDAAQVLIG
jgi:NAD-dependent SIR2 family protein deacetylase